MAIFCHSLGRTMGKKDSNSCVPMNVTAIWRINAILFGSVESEASLPCLTFFGQKRSRFGLFFLPFLGVANEQKDPNTCFPMYLDVIWHMKGFPFTLVESEASLPCSAVFVKKRSRFAPSSAMFGSCQGAKGP